MASASVQSPGEQPNLCEHREPEKPLVYEPPDLHGRKHVEKITTEYRVREDECLADRLQNEEFEAHFGKNKLDNKILHMDVKTAKSIYLREIEDSGMLSKDELSKLCKDDAFIAQEVEKRINENKDLEVQTKAAVELQDEEFAIYLQAREKQKLDEERKERLQLRVQQDREAAERLQRQLDSQAEEELVRQGISDVQLSKGEWAVECEVGSNPGATQDKVKAIKSSHAAEQKRLQELEMEQKRLEEERDRKIAIQLQRAEAEEYQRVKRERQFRRVQSEKRHDGHPPDMRRQISADSNGRSQTPPERRRNANHIDRIDSPVRNNANHYVERNGGHNSPSRTPANVDRIDSPQRKPHHIEQIDSPNHINRPDNHINRPDNHINRTDIPSRPSNPPAHIDSVPATRNRPKVEGAGAGKLVRTDSPMRNIDNNKKLLQSVDATGRPIHDPANRNVPEFPIEPSRPARPPDDGIYLTAIDAIGAVQGNNNNNGVHPPTNSIALNWNYSDPKRTGSDPKRTAPDPPKKSPHKQAPQNNWNAEMTRSGSVSRETDDRQRHRSNTGGTGTNHRNIAADLDPTYSTINHFKPQSKQVDVRPAPVVQNVKRTDIRPAPVVQNVKRTPSSDGEKKKKKWFSKK